MRAGLSKLKTLSLLSGTVGILSIVPFTVFGATYSATGDWSVTKSSDGNYCTAVQGFTQQAVITVGQRADGALSVALDFQKDILDTTKSHTAKLTANGVSRTFTTRTASPSTLVVAVGIDDSFYVALKNAVVLGVSIDGNKHDFSLKQAASGLQALSQCSASLPNSSIQASTSSPTISESSAPSQPVPSVQSSTVQTTSSSASGASAALLAENASLKDALGQLRQQYENLASQGTTSARASELEEKLAIANRELQQLRSQASIPQETAQDAQAVTNMQKALEDAQGKIITLESQLAQSRNQVTEAQQAATQDTQAETQLAALKNQVSELSSEKTRLEQEKIRLESEKNNLSSQLSKASAEAVSSEQSSAALTTAQNQLSSLQAEKIKLENDLKATQTTLAMMKGEQRETDEVKSNVKNLEERVAALQAENQNLQSQMASNKAIEDSSKNLTEEIAKLQTERAVMQGTINGLNDQISQLNSKIEQDTASLTATKSEEGNRVKVLETQIAMMKGENSNLQKELTDARNQMSSLKALAEQEKPEDNLKVSMLETQVTDLQGVNTRLEAELEAAKAEKAVTTQQNSDTNNSQLALLQTQVTDLQSENTTLKAQLAAAPDSNTVQQTELSCPEPATVASDTGKQDELRAQLRTVQTDYERLLAENSRLGTELDKMRTNIESDKLEVAGGDWTLEQATRRYQESQREIRRLGALLERQNSKCQAEKQEIEYMLFDPRLTETAQIAMLNSLEDQLNQSNTRVRELEGKLNLTPSSFAQNTVSGSSNVITGGTKVAAVDAAPVPTPQTSAKPILASVKVDRADMISVQQLSPDYYKGLLQNAGVSIQNLENKSSDGKVSYTWAVNNALYGTAQEVPLKGSFAGMVENYINTAKSRCQGEFAAVPVSTGVANPGNTREAYEIACVNGQGGLSASLLFFQKNDKFISIAHEGATDSMSQAMEIRDKLDKTIQKSS
ncbi:MAG: hypothetical protein CL565_05665 [Alphaproteobacteria bacterium]|nr:hypothetical protein [Alphaproteobacteria bacterium]